MALSITKNISSNEFTVALVLIILFVAIFFCHGLVRLCMLVAKRRKREQAAHQSPFPDMQGLGGYAIPPEPIPVVLARDEEAAGIESEATKAGPPAYGMWRGSVVCATSTSLVVFRTARLGCDFAVDEGTAEGRPQPPLLDAQRTCTARRRGI